MARQLASHTYNIDPKKILENFDKGNNPLFKHIERDLEPNRFLIIHPLVLDDGSLISNPMGGPLFKTDICGNLLWTESSFRYHSLEQDSDGIIWVQGTMWPYSDFVAENITGQGWVDDAIVRLPFPW